MNNIFLPLILAGTILASPIQFKDEQYKVNYHNEGSTSLTVYIFERPIFEDEVCQKVLDGASPVLTSQGSTVQGTFQGNGNEAIAVLDQDSCQEEEGSFLEFWTHSDYTEASS